MSRLRVAFLALCAVLLLAAANVSDASGASAAPRPSGPDTLDCSSWATVTQNTTVYASGTASITVKLQRQTPGYCDTFRSRLDLVGYGNVTMYSYRNGVTVVSTFATCNSNCTVYSVEWGPALPATLGVYGQVARNGVTDATVYTSSYQS
jgi:hypothetical protein